MRMMTSSPTLSSRPLVRVYGTLPVVVVMFPSVISSAHGGAPILSPWRQLGIDIELSTESAVYALAQIRGEIALTERSHPRTGRAGTGGGRCVPREGPPTNHAIRPEGPWALEQVAKHVLAFQRSGRFMALMPWLTSLCAITGSWRSMPATPRLGWCASEPVLN